MTIIELNIPSCAILNLNNLEDIKKTGSIDFYEIRDFNSKLVFYFRGLRDFEKKEIEFSLIKKF